LLLGAKAVIIEASIKRQEDKVIIEKSDVIAVRAAPETSTLA
jgi:hypothetical protein